MLFGNLIPGQFAEPQEAAVVRNGVKSHAPAKLLEESVIGMRQRFGEVQILAGSDADHRVARHHAFLQRRNRDHRLDRRARNEAGGKCQILIDDREDASAGRIDGDDRTVVAAQRVNGSLAHDRIVVCRDVALLGVRKRRHAVARG